MKMLTRVVKWATIVLFSLLLVICFSTYTLLSTPWAGHRIGSYLSRGNYDVTLASIEYTLYNPAQITLHELTVRSKKESIPLVKEAEVILTFTPGILYRIGLWDTIRIQDGELNLSTLLSERSPIRAQQLQLHNVDVVHPLTPAVTLSSKKINGTITPFGQPHPRKVHTITFALTARHIQMPEINIDNAVLSGSVKNGHVILTNAGGSIGHGFFLATGKRFPDGLWWIDNAVMHHLTVNNPNLFTSLTAKTPPLPKIHFASLHIIDSSLDLPTLTIEKANLDISDLRYENTWHTEKSTVWFDANSVRWNDELFIEPEIRLHASEKKICLDHASSQWRKGILELTGCVQQGDLRLHTLNVSGVEFILPEHGWSQLKQRWRIVDDITQLHITKLTVKSSHLINPDKSFPMQFIALTGSGTDIELIRDRQFQFWNGNGTFSADAASLNRIDLRYPEFTVSSRTSSLLQAEFNTLIGSGLLEGRLDYTPFNYHIDRLTLRGDNVNSDLLSAWKLIKAPPKARHFSAELFGLMPLDGKLTLSASHHAKKYIVQQGALSYEK